MSKYIINVVYLKKVKTTYKLAFLDSHAFPPYLFAFLLRILCQRRRRWVWFLVVAVAASRAADSRCGRCPLRRMLGSTRDFLGSCVVFLLR